MDLIELEILKSEFQNLLERINVDIHEATDLRKIFLNEFSLKKIGNMTIDEYVIGKGNKESFCYWLEQKLDKLGRIKGGSTAPKKFGVYFGRTKSDPLEQYRCIGKWGTNYEEAFNNVKNEIINLLVSGENENYENIESNKISPLFKGKLLSIYFPEKYLNIFSVNHLDHFIESLGINYNYKNSAIESKKKVLLQYKNEDEYFKELSNYQYTAFLYNKLTPPRGVEAIENKVKNVPKIIFHPTRKIKPTVIDLQIEQFTENSDVTNAKYNDSKSIDYENRIKRIGNRGELIVFNWEKENLIKNGKKDLADKVKNISKENLGYDILSFDLSGKEKHIEVKSTISKPPKINFYLTRNEFNIAKSDSSYSIFIVFEVNGREPKIFQFNPFKMDSSYYHMEPLLYHVKVNSMK